MASKMLPKRNGHNLVLFPVHTTHPVPVHAGTMFPDRAFKSLRYPRKIARHSLIVNQQFSGRNPPCWNSVQTKTAENRKIDHGEFTDCLNLRLLGWELPVTCIIRDRFACRRCFCNDL